MPIAYHGIMFVLPPIAEKSILSNSSIRHWLIGQNIRRGMDEVTHSSSGCRASIPIHDHYKLRWQIHYLLLF